MKYPRLLPLAVLTCCTAGCLAWVQSLPPDLPALTVTTLVDTQPLNMTFVASNQIDSTEFSLQEGTLINNHVAYSYYPYSGLIRQSSLHNIFWRAWGDFHDSISTPTGDLVARSNWDDSAVHLFQTDAQGDLLWQQEFACTTSAFSVQISQTAEHIYLLNTYYFAFNNESYDNVCVFTLDHAGNVLHTCAFPYEEAVGQSSQVSSSSISWGNVVCYDTTCALIMRRGDRFSDDYPAYLTTHDLITGDIIASIVLSEQTFALSSVALAQDAQGVHIIVCDADNSLLTRTSYDPQTLAVTQEQTLPLPSLAGFTIRYLDLVVQDETQMVVRIFTDDYTQAVYVQYDLSTQELTHVAQLSWGDTDWWVTRESVI